ncbi:vacuolar protein sorting-associated protein 33A-like [Tubulanus polymorphus]|uniref:vacuolar protein sorting-associated protein 33A-like n=1 Tax=Tubulanus polymorphus TaxID=672921 RepID=UPI003DA512EF
MASHLAGGKINLFVLREAYRRELLDCLDRCIGTKALVWDSVLTGPFGLVAEYPLLQEHEVEKMFLLNNGRLPQSNVQNIVFIVRPKLELMDTIAENILKEEGNTGFNSSSRKEYHILFVPRRSLICEKKLKDLNVYSYLNIKEDFCLDLIPFDYDLLSMENETSFRECYLYKDYTSLFHMAKSIMTIQALYGVIPNIYGKGDCAKHVCDMILRMRREMAGNEMQITPQIDNLVLLDRMVDPLTPLLSQLTYEGLIDEIFGIHNTTAKFPPEKFTKAIEDGAKKEEFKKIILNSGEELYAEIRDKNFNAVGPALSKKAKLISALADERHSAKTVGELRDFVTKLPHMTAAKQSLGTHTSIAELIKEVTDSDQFLDCLRTQQEFINGVEADKVNPYVEDCIARKEPIFKVLRLICIQCACNTGLKQKVLEHYKREILQTYGFKHVITLQNLEKAGLLHVQSKPIFPAVRKTLKLLVEEVQEQNPNDISYVYSGYAPVSVRLIQYLARPGWRSITELLNLLPGPRFEEVQQIPVGLRKRKSSISSTHSNTEQKTTLVVFLGGITYAELAALRFLAQSDDSPTDYIIATTKLINGDSWLSSMEDELKPPPPNPF